MKLEQLNHKNILSSFTRDFLVENLEKKRPHMLKALEWTRSPTSSLPLQLQNEPSDVIDWIAQTDPVAVKSNNKKTPFVNDIMQWYISRKIKLPEDIDTTREALEIYLKAKQSGPVDPLSNFDSPGEIRREYAGAESGEDKYDEAELVDTMGVYRLYKIDNYEQGAICFKDSGWCVKEEDYFNDYKPPFYMVTKAKKRYALLHKETSSLMDVYDNPLVTHNATPIKKWILQLWPNFVDLIGNDDLMEYAPLYPTDEVELALVNPSYWGEEVSDLDSPLSSIFDDEPGPQFAMIMDYIYKYKGGQRGVYRREEQHIKQMFNNFKKITDLPEDQIDEIGKALNNGAEWLEKRETEPYW